MSFESLSLTVDPHELDTSHLSVFTCPCFCNCFTCLCFCSCWCFTWLPWPPSTGHWSSVWFHVFVAVVVSHDCLLSSAKPPFSYLLRRAIRRNRATLFPWTVAPLPPQGFQLFQLLFYDKISIVIFLFSIQCSHCLTSGWNLHLQRDMPLICLFSEQSSKQFTLFLSIYYLYSWKDIILAGSSWRQRWRFNRKFCEQKTYWKIQNKSHYFLLFKSTLKKNWYKSQITSSSSRRFHTKFFTFSISNTMTIYNYTSVLKKCKVTKAATGIARFLK